LDSLRREEPDLPVTVFCSFDLPQSAACEVVRFDSAEHPLKQKVLVLPQSPYEQTLFLDTDTTVLGPIRPIFDHLQQADFCVANMFDADWTVRPPRLKNLVKPGDYNTGVLLYNKSAAAQTFLKMWADAVLTQDPTDMWAGHNCDQDYFNKIFKEGAMEHAGVRFQELANTVWNVRGIMRPELRRSGQWSAARIFHHRTRRMKLRKAIYGLGNGLIFRELARKAFNRLTGNRFLKSSVRGEIGQ
jgi:hypothetical protein